MKPIDPVIERMIDDQKQREQKKVQLDEQKKKQEDENLSKSMIVKVPTSARTHEEFMADQIKHEQQRYEKLKQIIEKEEENQTELFKPKLGKKTQELVQKKLETTQQQNMNPHERLYNAKIERDQTKAKTVLTADGEAKKEFVPSINKKSQNLKREEKIQDTLLEDAKRRLQKKNEYMKGTGVQNEQKAAVSAKSQKVIFQRFLSDFEAVCQHYEINESSVVSQETTLAVMADLGFMKSQFAVEDICKALKMTESTDTVKVFNIKVFLTAILNFNYPWMKAQEAQTTGTEEPRPKKKVTLENVGTINGDGNLQLLDEEI